MKHPPIVLVEDNPGVVRVKKEDLVPATELKGLVRPRSGGHMSNLGLFLEYGFNWQIVTDDGGAAVLIATPIKK